MKNGEKVITIDNCSLFIIDLDNDRPENIKIQVLPKKTDLDEKYKILGNYYNKDIVDLYKFRDEHQKK
jgi:hypothetical protein